MEQVWETLKASSFTPTGAACILVGGWFIFLGIRGAHYYREKRYYSTTEARVALLLAGSALIGFGLLNFLSILRETWAGVAGLMITGFLVFLEGIGRIPSGPGSGKRSYTIVGIIAMLVCVLHALAVLNNYWR